MWFFAEWARSRQAFTDQKGGSLNNLGELPGKLSIQMDFVSMRGWEKDSFLMTLLQVCMIAQGEIDLRGCHFFLG